MTKDIEREAFEAYELTKNPKCSRETLFKTWQDGDLEGEEKYYVGKYFDSFMQEKWELWVEAKKLEGCVVVPVEPTEAMIEAMEQFDDRHDYADMESAYRSMIEVARGGNE